uniref:Uncharacterized protein n=1 Tax=Ditylenchus dipsaci TaxID=166011 RepID=A0A915EE79_9BILA
MMLQNLLVDRTRKVFLNCLPKKHSCLPPYRSDPLIQSAPSSPVKIIVRSLPQLPHAPVANVSERWREARRINLCTIVKTFINVLISGKHCVGNERSQFACIPADTATFLAPLTEACFAAGVCGGGGGCAPPPPVCQGGCGQGYGCGQYGCHRLRARVASSKTLRIAKPKRGEEFEGEEEVEASANRRPKVQTRNSWPAVKKEIFQTLAWTSALSELTLRLLCRTCISEPTLVQCKLRLTCNFVLPRQSSSPLPRETGLPHDSVYLHIKDFEEHRTSRSAVREKMIAWARMCGSSASSKKFEVDVQVVKERMKEKFEGL